MHPPSRSFVTFLACLICLIGSTLGQNPLCNGTYYIDAPSTTYFTDIQSYGEYMGLGYAVSSGPAVLATIYRMDQTNHQQLFNVTTGNVCQLTGAPSNTISTKYALGPGVVAVECINGASRSIALYNFVTSTSMGYIDVGTTSGIFMLDNAVNSDTLIVVYNNQAVSYNIFSRALIRTISLTGTGTVKKVSYVGGKAAIAFPEMWFVYDVASGNLLRSHDVSSDFSFGYITDISVEGDSVIYSRETDIGSGLSKPFYMIISTGVQADSNVIIQNAGIYNYGNAYTHVIH